MRILLPHLVDLHVLPVENVFQFVVVDEVKDPVRRDVPGLGNLDLPQQAVDWREFVDDFLGEK